MKKAYKVHKEDKVLLKELYKRGKWDDLDNHVTHIMTTKNEKRIKSILKAFKKQRNDKEFKPLLDSIEERFNSKN